VPVVDVDRHRPKLEAREHCFDVLAAVVEIDADVVTGAYAELPIEGVRQPRPPGIELAKGHAHGPAREGLALGNRLGDELEKIGEVERWGHGVDDSAMRTEPASMS